MTIPYSASDPTLWLPSVDVHTEADDLVCSVELSRFEQEVEVRCEGDELTVQEGPRELSPGVQCGRLQLPFVSASLPAVSRPSTAGTECPSRARIRSACRARDVIAAASGWVPHASPTANRHRPCPAGNTSQKSPPASLPPAARSCATARSIPGILGSHLTPALWFDIAGAALLSAANPPLDAARLDIVPAGLWGRVRCNGCSCGRRAII